MRRSAIACSTVAAAPRETLTNGRTSAIQCRCRLCNSGQRGVVVSMFPDYVWSLREIVGLDAAEKAPRERGEPLDSPLRGSLGTLDLDASCHERACGSP
jgi:hypothetical protein